MFDNIRKIFYPKSVCVVGASTKEKSIGYELLNTIKIYGYKGKVLPVNPKTDEILGYKCFRSIDELPLTPDVGIIITPKKFVEDSIKSLLEKGTKSIVLITAGFKETGKEGAEAEERISKLISENGGSLIGPNCMGVINTLDDIKLNATFVAEKPERGSIGFLSQSGALGAAVLNSLRITDVRFAHFISVGNKADLTENEITLFWKDDSNIEILTYYLESFENGLKFLSPFIKREITKPAIVLKAGRTSGGMKAASSHTGALSTKDSVVASLLNQFGIIRAESIDELFNIAKGFESFPLPKGNKIGIVTNAGGPAILSVDSLEKEGLLLARLSEKTQAKLRQIVHPNGSVKNPVDLLPGATAENYAEVIKTVIADENVDAVISIFVEPVMVEPFGVVEEVNSIPSEKPILQAVMPLPEFWEKYRKESLYKTPLFRKPEEPAVVISKMLFYSEKQKTLQRNRKEYLSLMSKIAVREKISNERFLAPKETRKILTHLNFPLVYEQFLTLSEFENIGDDVFPLVLKGFAKGVTHKTEFKGVRLNIKNKEELFEAAESIKKSFASQEKEIEYFVLQPFLKLESELLVGASRDASFGPIVMFGSGGKYVEVLNDVAIRSAILSDADADEIIASTKIGKILLGVRGEKGVNTKPLKEILKKTALLMIENPQITEVDFNPVGLSCGEFKIIDARIKTFDI